MFALTFVLMDMGTTTFWRPSLVPVHVQVGCTLIDKDKLARFNQQTQGAPAPPGEFIALGMVISFFLRVMPRPASKRCIVLGLSCS